MPQRGPSPIDRQTKFIERFARREGVAIRRVYCDAGISGLTLNRPSLRRLLRDCRRGLIETVIVDSPDRLARSPELYHDLIRRFRACRVQVITS